MNTLQHILQTTHSTGELYSWGFAFEINDDRSFYSDPIYELILEAWARSKFTGKVIVYAGDVRGMSRHPVYLVQLIPVAGEEDGVLRGPGYETFQQFRDLVAQLASADSGMRFLQEYCEVGSATGTAATSIVRGCVELADGKVTRMRRVTSAERTFFEGVCLKRYPEAVEEIVEGGDCEDWT